LFTVTHSQPIMFRVTVDADSNERQGRVSEGVPYKQAIDNFVDMAKMLVVARISNEVPNFPNVVLLLEPTDASLSAPFTLFLHSHEVLNEEESFLVGIHVPDEAHWEKSVPFRQGLSLFWFTMQNMVKWISDFEYDTAAATVQNVVYFTTSTGVPLASLTVQM
jgi:hypothetical protein